jgi:hypothetical protein
MLEGVMNGSRTADVPLRGDLTASEVVLEAVAAVERTDPIDLTPPLYTAVDPEALDAVVAFLDRSGRIEFDYRGHRVTVDCFGVNVRPRNSTGDDGS